MPDKVTTNNFIIKNCDKNLLLKIIHDTEKCSKENLKCILYDGLCKVILVLLRCVPFGNGLRTLIVFVEISSILIKSNT